MSLSLIKQKREKVKKKRKKEEEDDSCRILWEEENIRHMKLIQH